MADQNYSFLLVLLRHVWLLLVFHWFLLLLLILLVFWSGLASLTPTEPGANLRGPRRGKTNKSNKKQRKTNKLFQVAPDSIGVRLASSMLPNVGHGAVDKFWKFLVLSLGVLLVSVDPMQVRVLIWILVRIWIRIRLRVLLWVPSRAHQKSFRIN